MSHSGAQINLVQRCTIHDAGYTQSRGQRAWREPQPNAYTRTTTHGACQGVIGTGAAPGGLEFLGRGAHGGNAMHRSEAVRGLLYVNPRPEMAPLLHALREAGWAPQAIPYSAEAVRGATRSGEFRVGVICIGGDEDVQCLLAAPDVLNDTPAEWIAVLPRPLLEHPEVRHLIAERFFDFHTLPLDLSRVLIGVGHAHGMAVLKDDITVEHARRDSGGEMVGESGAMLAFFRAIGKVAAADAPVLIVGESGTGKELTARTIHSRSSRSGRPFVAINCAALPATLIQSELFGHEKGAFTGASQRRVGRIEAAHGGTFLLDEIGDLPLDLQSNLLRFLQEGQVDRIGATTPVPVNVRVMAATHVDLLQAVTQGRFREDLYHRLNVLQLEIPPLRARREDIPILARYYFQQFIRDGRRSVRGLSREAMMAMNAHSWPGNVRELINRVRRAVVMCEGRLVLPGDLGLAGPCNHCLSGATLAEIREQAERDAILAALCRNGNNHSRAAKELGISRTTLYRLLSDGGADGGFRGH